MSLGKMSAEEKAAAKLAKAEAARMKREAAKAAAARAPKSFDTTRAENKVAKQIAKAKQAGDLDKAAALQDKLDRIQSGAKTIRAPSQRMAVPKETTVGCKAAPGGFCFDLGDANGSELMPLKAQADAIAVQSEKGSAQAADARRKLAEAKRKGASEEKLKELSRTVTRLKQESGGGRAFNYFANNLKDVCRVKKVAPSCVTPETADAEKPKKLAAWGKNGKFPDAKTEDAKRKACAAVGGAFNDGGAMPLRLGKTELDFLSSSQALDIGKQFRSAGGGANVPVRPGPNLRLCFTGSSKGAMVPLKDPKDAVKVRDEFRDCLASHGANPSDAQARACAISVGRKATGIGKGQETALFGVRRKKSRKARR